MKTQCSKTTWLVTPAPAEEAQLLGRVGERVVWGKWEMGGAGQPYSQRTPREMAAIPNSRQVRSRPRRRYLEQAEPP